MRAVDLFRFNLNLLKRHRFRTFMLLIAMSIGVIAVNLLTGLGEGARRFVLNEFSLLGNDTLIVLPGKKETAGGIPPIIGESPREVTIQDAQAIARIAGVEQVAPMVVGMSEVSVGALNRESLVLGTHTDFFAIRKMHIKQGAALPDLDFDQAEPMCVIGLTLKQELFPNRSALGEWIRLGDRRFRVRGVLENTGHSLGFDMNNIVVVPVAAAQALFNQNGLFRVFIKVRSLSQIEPAKDQVLALMRTRHDGEEDITIITQDAILSSFDSILDTLTKAVASIGAISLLVAGILIMNVMWISVAQRTAEIGLLKALGASQHDIRLLFLSESALLALIGSLLGIFLSQVLLMGGRYLYPDIPFSTPLWASAGSMAIALSTALAFAYVPARKAAALAPVEALQTGQGN